MTEQQALIELVVHEAPVPVVTRWAVAAFDRRQRVWKLHAGYLFEAQEAAERCCRGLDPCKWRLATVLRMTLGAP